MDLPDFLRFDPVPVRARRNGWTPDVQLRFVVRLARGAGPSEAARRVGRTKQTAYALRARPGADGFAAAWDAAVVFADGERHAPRLPGDLTAPDGLDVLLVPRVYRGRLVGYVQREDRRAALHDVEQLDRFVDHTHRAVLTSPEYLEALRAVKALHGIGN